MKKPILIWDIDGTLSDSSGAGINSLSRAITEHFRAPSPALDLAGATDGGIYRYMCEHFGRDFVESEQQDFYRRYLPILEENLTKPEFQGKLYPTVKETLQVLQDLGYTQGLLTGNIEHGAYLKNKAQGIEMFFPFGAYGCDHYDRNELGHFASRRASEHIGAEVKTRELLIIGDTQKDIACARACGAPVVAVTTGHCTRDELGEADWIIDQAEELVPLLSELTAGRSL